MTSSRNNHKIIVLDWLSWSIELTEHCVACTLETAAQHTIPVQWAMIDCLQQHTSYAWVIAWEHQSKTFPDVFNHETLMIAGGIYTFLSKVTEDIAFADMFNKTGRWHWAEIKFLTSSFNGIWKSVSRNEDENYFNEDIDRQISGRSHRPVMTQCEVAYCLLSYIR